MSQLFSIKNNKKYSKLNISVVFNILDLYNFNKIEFVSFIRYCILLISDKLGKDSLYTFLLILNIKNKAIEL